MTLAEMRRRYEDGATVEQIGALAGVAGSTVWERLRSIGVPIRPRGHHRRRSYNQPPLTYDELARTHEMYANGMSLSDIAARLGLSPATVAERLEKAGVRRRSLSEAQRLRHTG